MNTCTFPSCRCSHPATCTLSCAEALNLPYFEYTDQIEKAKAPQEINKPKNAQSAERLAAFADRVAASVDSLRKSCFSFSKASAFLMSYKRSQAPTMVWEYSPKSPSACFRLSSATPSGFSAMCCSTSSYALNPISQSIRVFKSENQR